MSLSTCTHAILYLSSVILLLLLLVCTIQLPTYFHARQGRETSSAFNHSQRPVISNPSQNLRKWNSNQTTMKPAVHLLHSNGSSSILHRLTFSNPVQPICASLADPNATLMIIVLSNAINFDHRQAIRATWGRTGKYESYTVRVKTVFFVGTDDRTQTAIRYEQAAFGDVVEIGVPENDPFAVHKELAALFWTRLHCPSARLLLRADDTLIVDIFLLLRYIENQIDLKHQDGIYGWFQSKTDVVRSGRWPVTRTEYRADTYPPYTTIPGYLFSNDTCQRLIDAAQDVHPTWIRTGNAYVTGLLRQSAGVPFYNYLKLRYLYGNQGREACDDSFERQSNLLLCPSKLFDGSKGDPDEYYDVWDVLTSRHRNATLPFR